jgi:hypothetical protein
MSDTTYKIVRIFRDDNLDRETLETGLTLAEVQAHCQDTETASKTATSREARERTAKYGEWFDAYYEED